MQIRTDLAMEQNWQGREGVCQYVQVLGHVQKTEVIVETDQAADILSGYLLQSVRIIPILFLREPWSFIR